LRPKAATRSDVFIGQGDLIFIREVMEKSGKSQRILKSDACGNNS